MYWDVYFINSDGNNLTSADSKWSDYKTTKGTVAICDNKLSLKKLTKEKRTVEFGLTDVINIYKEGSTCAYNDKNYNPILASVVKAEWKRSSKRYSEAFYPCKSALSEEIIATIRTKAMKCGAVITGRFHPGKWSSTGVLKKALVGHYPCCGSTSRDHPGCTDVPSERRSEDNGAVSVLPLHSSPAKSSTCICKENNKATENSYYKRNDDVQANYCSTNYNDSTENSLSAGSNTPPRKNDMNANDSFIPQNNLQRSHILNQGYCWQAHDQNYSHNCNHRYESCSICPSEAERQRKDASLQLLAGQGALASWQVWEEKNLASAVRSQLRSDKEGEATLKDKNQLSGDSFLLLRDLHIHNHKVHGNGTNCTTSASGFATSSPNISMIADSKSSCGSALNMNISICNDYSRYHSQDVNVFNQPEKQSDIDSDFESIIIKLDTDTDDNQTD